MHTDTHTTGVPLADRMRPETLDDVVGQHSLVGPGGKLRQLTASGQLPSLLLWGPPGSGKTTLARILARGRGGHFEPFSAVLGGVAEVRKIVDLAAQRKQQEGTPTVLFVDEIHRFSKSQQDAFLPHVERGTVILIGATTENPSFYVNAALLSRCTVIRLGTLESADIHVVLCRAVEDERGLGGTVAVADDALTTLSELAMGDARRGLSLLEQAAWAAAGRNGDVDRALVLEVFEGQPMSHDKKGDSHFDLLSAFIKSLRGSDPDAGLYWMSRLLEAGEDPLLLIRRLVIFASEDVGNADPRALQVAVSGLDAIRFLGLPEGRIPLAQVVTYLACAPKSNASYLGMKEAAAFVERTGPAAVPMRLRNAPTALMKEMGAGKGYRYPHDFPHGYVAEDYFPESLRPERFYDPKETGYEKHLREMMAFRRSLWGRKESDRKP